MRVLQISYTIAGRSGGIQAALVNLMNGFEKSNVSVDFVFVYDDKERAEVLKKFRDKKGVWLVRGKRFWRYSTELKQFLNGNAREYDIFHIHGIWTHTTHVAVQIARRHKIPYIISVHGMLEKEARQNKKWRKRLYWKLLQRSDLKNADAIHALTSRESQSIANLISHERIDVVPNCISASYNRRYKQNGTKMVVGFIGRLDPIKGIDRLIAAMNHVPTNVYLVIAGIGDANYENYVDELIYKSQAKLRIKRLGYIEGKEKCHFFNSIDILACPSFTEGLSMSILEGLAFATPALITEECGLTAIKKYKAGIVIENNEIQAISKGLVTLLKEDVKQMSKNAYKLFQKEFDCKRVVKKYINLYKQICIRNIGSEQDIEENLLRMKFSH